MPLTLILSVASGFFYRVFSPVPQEEARREKKRMEEEDSLEDLSFNGHLDSSLSVSLLER
jgi:hypothetical protein